jgi:hypothetical protein
MLCVFFLLCCLLVHHSDETLTSLYLPHASFFYLALRIVHPRKMHQDYALKTYITQSIIEADNLAVWYRSFIEGGIS